jgi:hypothetical protein
VWAATSTFAVDGLHIGVRANTTSLDEVLRAALAAHLVDDVEAPANYSVQLGEPSTSGAGAGFHFLYRSSASVVRTRDARRVVRGLFTHLSSHHVDPGPGLLRVHGVTLVAGDTAVLAPAALRQWPELIERRLNGQGLRFADTPWALVDPARAEVVVPEPSLDIDWSALDPLDMLAGGRGRPDPPVAPGRYPLVGWAFWVGADVTGRLSRAQAVMHALQLTIGAIDAGAGRGDVQRALDGLAAVVREIEPAAIAWDDPIELVQPLVALASGAPGRPGPS